jgi:hypothetical protein
LNAAVARRERGVTDQPTGHRSPFDGSSQLAGGQAREVQVDDDDLWLKPADVKARAKQPLADAHLVPTLQLQRVAHQLGEVRLTVEHHRPTSDLREINPGRQAQLDPTLRGEAIHLSPRDAPMATRRAVGCEQPPRDPAHNRRRAHAQQRRRLMRREESGFRFPTARGAWDGGPYMMRKRKNVSPMMTSSPPKSRRSVMSSPLTKVPLLDLLSSM